MRSLVKFRRKLTLLASLLLVFTTFRVAEGKELSLSRPLVLRWILGQKDLMNASPGFQSESLYLQTADGIITSVRVADGRLVWRGEVGGEFSTVPLADERAIYVASEPGLGAVNRSRGLITALSRASGITVWSRTLTSPIQSNLRLAGGALFYATRDGRLFSLSTETGETLWSTKYPHTFSETLLLSGRKLLLHTAEGLILSFDVQTGKPSWRYRTQDLLKGAIATADGRVYVGGANGYVTALEESAGGVILKWRRRVGTSVVGVSHTARGVVVVTGDNFVQLLSPKRGSRLWKQRMPGRVFAQALTDSENALFATLGGDACIVLSLESGRQVNYVSVGEGNGIVAMPVLTPTALIVPTRTGLLAFGQPEAE